MRFIIKHSRYFLILALLISLYLFLPVNEYCETNSDTNTTTCGQFSNAHSLAGWWRASFDAHWIEIASTFVIACFTIALWFSTAALSSEAKAQRSLTIRALRIAEADSANARRSADIAEQTLIATNRPWIELAVDFIARDAGHPEDVIATARIRAKNVGATPAIKIMPFFEATTLNEARASIQRAKDAALVMRRENADSFDGSIAFPDGKPIHEMTSYFHRPAARNQRAIHGFICGVTYSFPFDPDGPIRHSAVFVTNPNNTIENLKIMSAYLD